jgi:predicted pyridoxine 5'-phosphate oxidase superfamily flavin-nucleotide-binding protein
MPKHILETLGLKPPTHVVRARVQTALRAEIEGMQATLRDCDPTLIARERAKWLEDRARQALANLQSGKANDVAEEAASLLIPQLNLQAQELVREHCARMVSAALQQLEQWQRRAAAVHAPLARAPRLARPSAATPRQGSPSATTHGHQRHHLAAQSRTMVESPRKMMTTTSAHRLTSHIIKTEAQLRVLIGNPAELTCAKISDRLNSMTRLFIERSPFVCFATSDREGNCDLSPRGDPAGFVRIIDERTLLIPERPGNRLADSLRNVLANPHIGLLFAVPGVTDTLRVNGRAAVTVDAELLAPCAVEG